MAHARNFIFGAVILGVAAVGLSPFAASKETRLLQAACEALDNRNFELAEQLAKQTLKTDPANQMALAVAGDAAAGLHEVDRAIAYYSQVTTEDQLASYRATLGLGIRWHFRGRMADAEQCYRDLLAKTPDSTLVNKRLSDLLQAQGRTWEAIEPSMRLLRQGEFGATELHLVACPETRFRNDKELVARARLEAPSEPGPRLAEARLAMLQNNVVTAQALYREIIDLTPLQPQAVYRLGRLLIDAGHVEEFVSLDERFADETTDYPGIWLNRGLLSSQADQHDMAVNCFATALSAWPNHVEANYLISQSLAVIGDGTAAEVFGERSRILARIELTIPEFYDDPTDDRMQALVADFRLLERYWEAAAICEFADMLRGPMPEWVPEQMASLRPFLATQCNLTVTPAPIEAIKGRIKLPQYNAALLTKSRTDADLAASDDASRISFNDVAEEVGLDFRYFNGSLSQRGMEHIFETTGGGVAAVDYDANGWPDLYFTQGAPLWEGDDQIVRRDQLFRNIAGTHFASTTEQAGLGDEGFGQGVTYGDFNADGFPDIYVANLHGNRFYHNNGDGTFTDVTESTGTAGDEWSLSCVLADFDGDSLQDLYVVNYLNKEAVFERRCRSNGAPLTCAPTLFPAAQDRVYRNLGDGRFEEVTDRCGVTVAEGKGLAILAADFDGNGRLSVFVGNDTTPNFFFANESSQQGEIAFSEVGLVRGLALDGEGRSQATMGIACGDINSDGRFDLFITNFFEDANTLYVQQPGGFFADATRSADLYQASYQMLGFGTEFLDADLDGHLDLFITNGHVDQTDATGEPDRMPAQFFRNHNGKFVELMADQLGPYFERKLLGRTVTRLDWNRDGQDDLCTLGLYEPVSLLANQSDRAGQTLQLKLIGTASDRDAVGARITVRTESKTLTSQVVAGDGYMTANDRRLTLGLGPAQTASIRIEWPSGNSDEYANIQADTAQIIVEKRGVFADRMFPKNDE